jgi:hypothetical protein
MLKYVLAAVQAVSVLALSACVGTADRLVTIRGKIVTETGAPIAGCELTLAEKSKSPDKFVARRPVDASFAVDVFTWAPASAELEVGIKCPNVEPYVSKPISVSSAGRNGIDVGQVMLRSR